jgi:hypothetical protein
MPRSPTAKEKGKGKGKLVTKTEIEFLNTRLPHYYEAVKILQSKGFKSRTKTSGTRKEILDSYYKYLVNIKAAELGGRSLTPVELDELYKVAKDNVEHYEMYTKQTKVPITEMEENMEMNLPEEFATFENVEKMQNNYQMMHNLEERMKRTMSREEPSISMPKSSYAQALLLGPQYKLSNWYNYRKEHGMKNSSSDSMDGGKRSNPSGKRSTRKRSSYSSKRSTRKRSTRKQRKTYRKRA